jgi:hypothetical protein
MTRRPGTLIRAIAARLCDAQAIERVIDPALADLQLESETAAATGRPWRRRWLWMTTSIALVRAVVICAGERLWLTNGDMSDSEGARALVTSLVATAAALTLFVLPALPAVARADWRMVVLLIPQAVPIALPIGLSFGVLACRRDAPIHPRLARRLVINAVIWSAASFVMLGWIVPNTNQTFRELMYSRSDPPRVDGAGPRRPLARGRNELTIVQLEQQLRAASADHRVARGLAFTYYQRWALASATLVMVCFALGAIRRWRIGLFSGSMVALSSDIAYWLLLEAGRQYALDGSWSSVAGAWLPNVCFAAVAVVLVASANPNQLAGSRSA